MVFGDILSKVEWTQIGTSHQSCYFLHATCNMISAWRKTVWMHLYLVLLLQSLGFEVGILLFCSFIPSRCLSRDANKLTEAQINRLFLAHGMTCTVKSVLLHLLMEAGSSTSVFPISVLDRSHAMHTCHWSVLRGFSCSDQWHTDTHTLYTHTVSSMINLSALKMVSCYVLDFPLLVMFVSLILDLVHRDSFRVTGVGCILNNVTLCSFESIWWNQVVQESHILSICSCSINFTIISTLPWYYTT